MKSKKLLNLINAKREEARGLMDADKMADAKKLAEEIRGLEEDLKTALELEEGELRSLRKNGQPPSPTAGGEVRQITREDELRALGKHLVNAQMADEERALVTVAGNGGLLPEGYINDLQVLRNGYPSLKKYCHVIPVTTKDGKMPVATLGNNKLAKLSSDAPIPDGAVNTGSVRFEVEDYGKFIPVENSLTDDEVVGLIQNVVLPDLAEGGIETENEEILVHVKKHAVAVAGTDYTAIEKAMDELVPSCRAGVITITGTKGFTYLKNRKDAVGRNLGLITDVGGVKMFNGKPIIELSDELITPTTEGNLAYYTVNLREMIKFFDRKGIVITKSKEFLFNKNQDCLRAIQRFDTEKSSVRSCKKVEFAPAPNPTATGLSFEEANSIEL